MTSVFFTYDIESYAEYNVEISKANLDKILKRHFYYGVMEINETLYKHKYPSVVSKSLFDKIQDIKKDLIRKISTNMLLYRFYIEAS